VKQVVVTETIHPDAVALLNEQSNMQITYLDGDKSKLTDCLPGANAILVRAMALGDKALSTATQLDIVSRHGVGCDNVAVDHLSARNIPVAIAVDSNTTSVVEHTLMMMLALNKQALAYDKALRSRNWSERGQHVTSELDGKRILIVGFGRIGKRVAGVCKAFGMDVTVADIALDAEHANLLGCQGVEDFRPHLATADYLSVHVPLDSSTRHLIGKAELAQLPGHAIVINCARGGVIDEQAIANAIHSDDIAAFGSDVFTEEPVNKDNVLLDLPRTILTPHNAAGTNESMRRMAMYAAQNIIDCFDDRLGDEFIFNAAALGA